MKLLKQLDGLLKNTIVLYIVLFLTLTNVFGYVMTRNYDAIYFFVLVAFLSTKFTKNNILVALIALCTTNLLLVIVQGRRVYEAFTEANDHAGESGEKEKEKEKEKVEVDKEATKKANVELAAAAGVQDSEEFKDHMQNLDKIENLLDKQEGLVGSLGKIENMMARLEKINGKLKPSK